MTNPNVPSPPVMAVVHDASHGDVYQLMQEAGVSTPYIIQSFTDVGVRTDHKHDDQVRESVYHEVAGLFIQQDLIHPVVSETARVAIDAALQSDRLQNSVRIFNKQYLLSPKLAVAALFHPERHLVPLNKVQDTSPAEAER